MAQLNKSVFLLALFWLFVQPRRTMSYKQNGSRRHKIEKSWYKVTNWRSDKNELTKRGDFVIFYAGRATDEWRPSKT